MEKYAISLNNIFIVLAWYIVASVFLNFNTTYQKIKLSKQLYVIKNIVKSFILFYIGILSTIDLAYFIINNHFDMTLVYYYASLYVSNDILALIIVPNLPKTTQIHHQITSLFLLYALNVDFNDISNVGKLLFIYTIFSSYSFLVNFYLGLRYLKNESCEISPLNTIIEYSRVASYHIYKSTCIVNWIIQGSIIIHRIYIGIFNLHYFVYCILLIFIIKDDLILMNWLKKKNIV